VDLISGGIGSLDLNVYEQLEPRGKRLAFDQDLHWILHDEPNKEMTGFTFMKTLQCHALLWGNAYAEIERDQANRIKGLWPRDPNATRPRRLTEAQTVGDEKLERGALVYTTTDGAGLGGAGTSPERLISADNMLHVLGLSLDGRLAKSVVELSRQVMGLSLATEKFAGKFFANGIRPTGVVELPNTMKPEAIQAFKQSLRESQGGENMLTPMVLETGMTWHQSDVKPNEAQFLETRVHQRQEIGAIFHVPERMLGEGGKSNRATAEQEAIEFVQYTLRPWIKAWEPELKRKLFPKTGRTAGKYFPGFYYQDLLTPDAESRGKLIALLKQWGIANSDDIREFFLDWNPIKGPAGETYWMPVNMQDAAHPLAAKPGDGQTAEPNSPAADDKAAQRYSRLFTDAFNRLQALNKPDARDFHRAFAPILMTIADAAFASTEEAMAPPEVQDRIGVYISGMHKRLAGAKVSDDVLDNEFRMAINAVRAAARQNGTAKPSQEAIQ
jgi:HK97 family phage portal protein